LSAAQGIHVTQITAWLLDINGRKMKSILS
jgi:hypothetical protein